MSEINEILDFWFQGITDETLIDRKIPPFCHWFKRNNAFDNEIKERFAEDHVSAKAGRLESWKNSPEGLLALILLLDQFPRNMYRNTMTAYETDASAQDLAEEAINQGADRKLKLIERIFLYFPFQHAEDPALQERSIQLHQELVREAKKKYADNAYYYEYNLKYAEKHHASIKQFGRFPHRNFILGRPSTPEEEEFLSTPRLTI